jgi:hypothetical protein
VAALASTLSIKAVVGGTISQIVQLSSADGQSGLALMGTPLAFSWQYPDLVNVDQSVAVCGRVFVHRSQSACGDVTWTA